MQEKQYSSQRWIIQAMLMLLQIGMGLNFMSPTPLFTVIMSDYDIGRSSVSLLVSATIIMVTVALLPGGVLIAKIGSKRAMTIAGFLMSAHCDRYLKKKMLTFFNRVYFYLKLALTHKFYFHIFLENYFLLIWIKLSFLQKIINVQLG